jgi:hypothetical protein
LPSAPRGIALSATGGIALGVFYPLLTRQVWAEPATSRYGTAALFAGGILISAFLYNPFFHEFPGEINGYFKAASGNICWGYAEAGFGMAGGIANFVAINSSGLVRWVHP